MTSLLSHFTLLLSHFTLLNRGNSTDENNRMDPLYFEDILWNILNYKPVPIFDVFRNVETIEATHTETIACVAL